MPDKDVLSNGKTIDHHDFLGNVSDSFKLGVVWGFKLDRFVIETDVPVKRTVRIDTIQDFHQGGFARTVFTQQGMNVPAPDFDGHIIQRLHTWKFLGDLLHLENHVRVGRHHSLIAASTLSSNLS